jgi:pyruvate dehydrogenase E1 component
MGDLIWAAGDARCRGFLIGGTAGRTTLFGEGLQHQDGHSHLFASAYPTVRPYEPSFAYEIPAIVLDGMRRMYQEGETAMYYITIQNENHEMPSMPEGASVEDICRGLYHYASRDAGEDAPRVQLFGSGTIMFEVLRAQEILAEQYEVASDVWSATSYCKLRRDALEAERWSRLHPDESPRQSYLEETLADVEGPFMAASDWVRGVPEQIDRWVPGGLTALGTDGFGRSDAASDLRRFFEVDAESIVLTALHRLALEDRFDREALSQAIEDLNIDPDKPVPWKS